MVVPSPLPTGLFKSAQKREERLLSLCLANMYNFEAGVLTTLTILMKNGYDARSNDGGAGRQVFDVWEPAR